MAIVTGPGPYRTVPDAELRLMFYFTSTRGYVLEIIPFTTSPPPGTSDPRVTALLRRLLYLRRIDPPTMRQLADDIRNLQTNRNMIAISAKLLSLMQDAFERPWAYPGLLTTAEILDTRKAASGVADATRLPANFAASTPAAVALSYLSKLGGFVAAHTSYMATVANRNYEYRVQRMDTELSLRGVNPELPR